MTHELFPDSVQLEGPYRLDRMTQKQVPAVVSIMLASEPWMSYGFEGAVVERFMAGSVEAGLARSLIHVMEPDEDSPGAEEVIGVVVIHPGFLGGRYLEILAISERHRGKTLGTQIINLLCRESPAHMRDLFVLVSLFNQPAVGFYEKQGFIDVGDLPGLILPGKVERLIWLRFRN